LSFCHLLECQAPPHKPKASPQKRKAPLVKTFWRRFWSRYVQLRGIRNVVYGYCFRYTVLSHQNTNHLDQNIGSNKHKVSLLVKDKTAECIAPQEKKTSTTAL